MDRNTSWACRGGPWLVVAALCGLGALGAPAWAQAPDPDHASAAAPGVAPGSVAAILDWASPAGALAVAALGGHRGVAQVGLWQQGAARFGSALLRVGPVPEQALFEIGSLSKVFTGLLLAQAVERGDLALDDALGPLLQGVVTQALPPPVAAITLRQLVTHTSCLARLPGDFFTTQYHAPNPYRRYDRARLWASLAQARLAQSPPCAGGYSNWGFGVLGEILSLRYGKPWAQLVREQITTPLGMNDTVQVLGDKAARLATPYEGEQEVSVWDFDAMAGAGALRSTTADMLRLSQALLAGAGGPLGPAAARLMTPLAEHEGAQIGYALMLRERDGRRTWLHGGGTGGYRSTWVLAPDTQEAAIAMVSNARAQQSDVLTPLLLARYPAPVGRPAAAGDPVERHVGVYRALPQLTFSFAVLNGQLHSRVSGGRFEPLQVSPSGKAGEFTQPASGRQFRFAGGEAGAPASVRYERFGVQLLAERVDEPLLGLAPEPSQKTLAPLVGRYRTAGGRWFDVQAQEGRLQVQYASQPRFAVYPLPGKPDWFAYDGVRAQLQFERYASGEVRSLKLHQNGVIHAVRVDP